MDRRYPNGHVFCGQLTTEKLTLPQQVLIKSQKGEKPCEVKVSCTVLKTSRLGDEVAQFNTQVFAISFLEAGQKDLAASFFKPKTRVGNKFENVEFYEGEATGCPIIKDSLGYIECKVVGTVEEGDHTVYVGEVISSGIHREGEQLLLSSTGWEYGG